MTCRVEDCGKKRDKENHPKIRFFECPVDKTTERAWMKACGQSFAQFKRFQVCSDHFAKDDYELQERILQQPFSKWRLKKDAVPTLNLPIPGKPPTDRTVRATKRRNKETVSEAMEEFQQNKAKEAKVFVSATSQTT